MRKIAQFRVNEELAKKYLGDDCGTPVNSSVREVVTPVGSPLYERIGDVTRALAPDDYLFTYWDITIENTEEELDNAEIFLLYPYPHDKTYGRSVGTGYDFSKACQRCWGGFARDSQLKLDLRKMPKKWDWTMNGAHELTVNQRLADLILKEKLTGCELSPVEYAPFVNRPDFDCSLVPSGREYLRKVEEASGRREEWYLVYLEEEIGDLYLRAYEEHVKKFGESRGVKAARTRGLRAPAPDPWYELVPSSQRLNIDDTTHVGDDPFLDESNNQCDHAGEWGHVMGLNLVPEFRVTRDSWDGSDFCVTGQLLGHRFGDVCPGPALVVSQRFRQLMIEHNIKGYELEIAQLV